MGGIRTAFIEALRRVKPSVIRYPGGCFADSYNWRDGIGERSKRPQRTNIWSDDPEFRKTPDGAHSAGSSDHGAPVQSIHEMPSKHCRSGTGGRPPRRFGVRLGSWASISFHCLSLTARHVIDKGRATNQQLLVNRFRDDF